MTIYVHEILVSVRIFKNKQECIKGAATKKHKNKKIESLKRLQWRQSGK